MRITSELGREIIGRVSEYTDVDINIMNLDGRIVSSTDSTRVNEIHNGAIEVLKTSHELIINKVNVEEYEGAKSGVNLPITHHNRIVGVVGVSGDPSEIWQVTGLIRASVEMVLEQIHIQRQEYFVERQWSYWLQQLLHPSGFDEVLLKEEANYSLQVNTESNWRIIVLAGENQLDLLEPVRREIKRKDIHTLFILPFADKEILIVIPSTYNRLDDLAQMLLHSIKSKVRIGIGDSGFGIKGIRESYHQAKQALAFEGENRTVTYSENWKIERLTTAISSAEFDSICLDYEHYLKELDEVYLETIDTYLNMDFSVKKSAESLHIHRNTLLYRLDQITKRVGLDPRSFQDAFILKVIRSRS